jgi:hypothetical protein
MNNERKIRECAVYMFRNIHDILQPLGLQQQQERCKVINSSKKIDKHSKFINSFFNILTSLHSTIYIFGGAVLNVQMMVHTEYIARRLNVGTCETYM